MEYQLLIAALQYQLSLIVKTKYHFLEVRYHLDLHAATEDQLSILVIEYHLTVTM